MTSNKSTFTRIDGSLSDPDSTLAVGSNGIIGFYKGKEKEEYILTKEQAVNVIDVLSDFIGVNHLQQEERLKELEKSNKALIAVLQEEGVITLCEHCHLPILEDDHTRSSDDMDLHKKCFNEAFEDEIKANKLEPR